MSNQVADGVARNSNDDCTICDPRHCLCDSEKCQCNKCRCKRPLDCTCKECICSPEDVNDRTKPLKIGERPPDSAEFLSGLPTQGVDINNYFKDHKIHEFIHFLMCHLLAKVPENPISFLQTLLKKIVNYQKSFISIPPLLFEDQHIEALYRAMDPLSFNVINYNQYANGFLSLGINNYTNEPPLDHNGMISKEFFCTHAKECLVNALNELLLINVQPETKPVRDEPEEESNDTIEPEVEELIADNDLLEIAIV